MVAHAAAVEKVPANRCTTVSRGWLKRAISSCSSANGFCCGRSMVVRFVLSHFVDTYTISDGDALRTFSSTLYVPLYHDCRKLWLR